MPVLSVQKVCDSAIVPTFEFKDHYTLYAMEDTHLDPNDPALIRIGVKLSFPRDHCAFIVGNGCVKVLAGLIDSDYRGAICVIAISTSEMLIKKGEAVAKMFVLEIALPDIRVQERYCSCEDDEQDMPAEN